MRIEKLTKGIGLLALLATGGLIRKLLKDDHERTLPSVMHEELANAGIDIQKIYNGTITAEELIAKGFDPIEIDDILNTCICQPAKQ